MQPSTLLDDEQATSKRRYEFRVWGGWSDACRQLKRLAGDERRQRLSDCYLLGGDPARNTKIRHSKVKVKHLVEERQGFQRWSSVWHGLAEDAPRPFDRLLDEIHRSAPESDDYQHSVTEAVEDVESDDPLQAVFVTKHRRRFLIGSMKAESTRVGLDGRSRSMHTLAIEGPDIQELIQLRAVLGLTGVPNLALHLAVGLECGIG